jgi:hypothetical protein
LKAASSQKGELTMSDNQTPKYPRKTFLGLTDYGPPKQNLSFLALALIFGLAVTLKAYFL